MHAMHTKLTSLIGQVMLIPLGQRDDHIASMCRDRRGVIPFEVVCRLNGKAG